MTSSHPHAFSRRERIRKRRAYLDIQGAGRKYSTAHLLVFVRPVSGAETEAATEPAPGAPGPVARRVGFTVSKKVGDAVVRNRVKRRLREIWRQHKEWFPSGRDVVLVARPVAATASSRELEAELEKLCLRCFGRS